MNGKMVPDPTDRQSSSGGSAPGADSQARAAVRRRRKEDRPAEITAAARQVFLTRGYAAARMDEVAAVAGISKGLVFRYFPTKQDLFRAVARALLAEPVRDVHLLGAQADAPFATVLPRLLERLASAAGGEAAALAAIVLAEARSFPDLARLWHDEVAGRMLRLVSDLVARGQARGEVRAGDPDLLALGIISPIILGSLFGATMGQAGIASPDMAELARLHAASLAHGLLT